MMKALLCLTAIGLCLGVSPPAWADAQPTLEDVRVQGVHYFKRQKYRLAFKTLTKAYEMNGGTRDFRTVFYRGRAAVKIRQLELAFEMLGRACTLGDAKEKAKAKETLADLRQLYGPVRLAAAKGESNEPGRVYFEAKVGFVNKLKRKIFGKIRKRYRETDISLPIEVYLPYGEYLANKVPFVVAEGKEASTVEIFLAGRESSDEEFSWGLIGAGMGAVAALGIGLYFLLNDPAPIYDDRVQVQLHSLTVPSL